MVLGPELKECPLKDYVNVAKNYFDNLSQHEENTLKRAMRRPFTTMEQELEGKRIISNCAKNKLGLSRMNLPFGWMNSSRCNLENETDILGTLRNQNGDCLPMWYNLRDRMEFYKACLKSYDIRKFKQSGTSASRNLQDLAFELHKLEKQKANNRLGGGSAMIAGGIMGGIGVQLPLFAFEGSNASSSLSLKANALSLSGSLATMFGENPQKKVNDAAKEIQGLKDEGSSISALLILYMVSHQDLQDFVHRVHIEA